MRTPYCGQQFDPGLRATAFGPVLAPTALPLRPAFAGQPDRLRNLYQALTIGNGTICGQSHSTAGPRDFGPIAPESSALC